MFGACTFLLLRKGGVQLVALVGTPALLSRIDMTLRWVGPVSKHKHIYDQSRSTTDKIKGEQDVGDCEEHVKSKRHGGCSGKEGSAVQRCDQRDGTAWCKDFEQQNESTEKKRTESAAPLKLISKICCAIEGRHAVIRTRNVWCRSWSRGIDGRLGTKTQMHETRRSSSNSRCPG